MHEEPGTDGAVALPAGGAAGALSPRAARLRGLLPAERLQELLARWRALAERGLSAREGAIALGAIAVGVFAVVLLASGGTESLVPRTADAFPNWEAGPLEALFGHVTLTLTACRFTYSGLLLAMTAAYGVALLAARSLPMRTVWLFALGTALLLALGPPLALNDVWNYLGYARLGAVHHLNPYQFEMKAESNDPIFTFTSWKNYPSPYGPLFTALTYPLGFLPIAVAYWVLKIGIVAVALGFVWTVAWCARLLGRDPRLPVMFVVANPIYLFYAVGGFHNDFLMLLPATAAFGLLLDHRDRSAGAAMMLAVAIKPTAVVLLPFLLIGARPPARRPRVLVGCLAAAVPLAAVSLALFGLHMPNVATQSRLVTGYSIPNLFGLLLGLGGATTNLERLANLGVVLVILWGLRKRDWIAWSGWATVALVASLSWLMPWYVVWVLPLAAIASSRRLRRVAVALTVFLVLSFAPATGPLLASLGFRPMMSAGDQASMAYQDGLQGPATP